MPGEGAARQALLAWYDRERRDLPWRGGAGPWAVWVSEILLQQTRVEVAIPYFRRFLERFPDPGSLAAAGEEEVLALWSGLGYYRRARLLREAAREVVAAGGEIPRRAAELEKLPGIGPYTAAAVASIAFGERVAVLDGNVARVMARRLGFAGPIESRAARDRLRDAALGLVDPERPGDSNQALMELGATLCSPRGPRCGSCPLAAGCVARERDLADSIPMARKRPRPRRVRLVAARVEDAGGRWLLFRRGDDEELLPGLWEPPIVPGERPEAALFAARYGGAWSFAAAPELELRHTITDRRIELTLWRAEWSPQGIAEPGAARWLEPGGGEGVALTGVARKLLASAPA